MYCSTPDNIYRFHSTYVCTYTIMLCMHVLSLLYVLILVLRTYVYVVLCSYVTYNNNLCHLIFINYYCFMHNYIGGSKRVPPDSEQSMFARMYVHTYLRIYIIESIYTVKPVLYNIIRMTPLGTMQPKVFKLSLFLGHVRTY